MQGLIILGAVVGLANAWSYPNCVCFPMISEWNHN